MPRPVSWLPRLHEITRSVAGSVRSHYDRRDIERLFELQPRAALNLIEMLPSVKIGTAVLIERETLANFLERVRESEDTAELFEKIRKEKTESSRRRIRPLVRRALVRRDLDPVDLSSLPDTMTLSPGRLEVRFHSTEELAESMLLLARVLTDEPEEFARRYELTSDSEADGV